MISIVKTLWTKDSKIKSKCDTNRAEHVFHNPVDYSVKDLQNKHDM